jgi:hypothetical protein
MSKLRLLFQAGWILAGSVRVANPQISATPAVTASASVSVTFTPASATTLYAGQTLQLNVSVANANDTAVTWTVSPALGTISPTGLYTAPAAICSGQTVTVPLCVPSPPSGDILLSLRIHGLRYSTEASVLVNQMAMTPINSSTVTILGNGAAYGGIGGGFSTLDITMNLPVNTLAVGETPLPSNSMALTGEPVASGAGGQLHGFE